MISPHKSKNKIKTKIEAEGGGRTRNLEVTFEVRATRSIQLSYPGVH